MCLIVAKPRGRNLPSDKELKDWFKTHKDGMGLMFNHGNKVHILKGAMNVKEMFNLIDKMRKYIKPYKTKDINIVFHFRQATEGQVCQSNCHPFPITKDKELLASTDVLIDKGIVHNGMIFDYATYSNKQWIFNATDKTTDTQKFIEEYIADLGDIVYSDAVQRLIAAYTDSKFTILTDKGIVYIGEFINDKGLYYSNGTYKQQPVVIPAKINYTKEYNSLNDYGRYMVDDYCEYCHKLYDLDDLVMTDDGSRLCHSCHDIMYPQYKRLGLGYDW